jgi:GNAT superfamily N-acetyltransferase
MDGSSAAIGDAVERPLGPEHAERLVALSAEAGWNQIAADWRFMLERGRGIGMADASGAWVASALTLPLGNHLSWISMVLTTRAWRGRGIGTHLLRRCIDIVRASGAAAGLDATELGRPIYLPLGFVDRFPLTRWHLERAPAPAPPPPARIRLRRAAPADLGAIAAYDRPRSGMDRAAILAHLHGRAADLAFVAEDDGGIAGFAFGRDGRIARHVGPIVADSDAVGLALAAKATAAAAPPFLLDVPDRHAGMRAWLEASGARAPRGFMRMTFGEVPGLAAPERLYAVCGPELA